MVSGSYPNRKVVEHHRVDTETLVTSYQPVLYIPNITAVVAACPIGAEVFDVGFDAIDRDRVHQCADVRVFVSNHRIIVLIDMGRLGEGNAAKQQNQGKKQGLFHVPIIYGDFFLSRI